jgi:hypothetical protein
MPCRTLRSDALRCDTLRSDTLRCDALRPDAVACRAFGCHVGISLYLNLLTITLQYHKWYYENFKIICKYFLTFPVHCGTMVTVKETHTTERIETE